LIWTTVTVSEGRSSKRCDVNPAKERKDMSNTMLTSTTRPMALSETQATFSVAPFNALESVHEEEAVLDRPLPSLQRSIPENLRKQTCARGAGSLSEFRRGNVTWRKTATEAVKQINSRRNEYDVSIIIAQGSLSRVVYGLPITCVSLKINGECG